MATAGGGDFDRPLLIQRPSSSRTTRTAEAVAIYINARLYWNPGPLEPKTRFRSSTERGGVAANANRVTHRGYDAAAAQKDDWKQRYIWS